MSSASNSNEKVSALEDLMIDRIEEIFPPKEIKIYEGDKEFMNPELRKLRRQRSRKYVRNKKSIKFVDLQKKYLEMKIENSEKNTSNKKLKS